MSEPTFAAFQAEHLAQGFDEVLQRQWQPDTVIDTHTHPFAVKALVVAGSLQLTVGAETRQLGAGDRFELARDIPHVERYGPHGATFWVARKH
jgi:quercetin dioxygenase-like cupin family protein